MLSTTCSARICSKYSVNPAQSATNGRCPASGNALTLFRPRRGEKSVHALKERRRGRQRDEVRDVAREQVRHAHGRVAAVAADVDMLAEHGELLGEIAVEIVDVLIARRIEDALFVPLLKGVRAAAGDTEIQAAGLAHHRVADARRAPAAARRSHAESRWLISIMASVSSGLMSPGCPLLSSKRQQIAGRAREVVVAGVENLQLELDAEGVTLRGRKWECGHAPGALVTAMVERHSQ